MVSKILLLYVPAAACAAGLLAFLAFHAWPLTAAGELFGSQPGYPAGYDEGVLLVAIPLWYLVGYGIAALLLLPFSGAWTTWARPAAAVATAIVVVGLSFVALYAAALGGSHSSGGLGMRPFHALSAAAMPALAPLRRAHYLAHLEDPDPIRRTRAASGVYLEARSGAKGDATLQLGMARALRTADEEVRHDLVQGLIETYPLARPALLEVVARLGDAPEQGRVAIAELLGTLASYGQPEPELRAALLRAAGEDPARPVREAAVAALRRGDREDPELLALLQRWAAEGDRFAASTLAGIAGGEPAAARAYGKGLASADPETRRAWTENLDALALDSTLLDVRAALDRALADPDPRVRLAALEVLGDEERVTVPRVQRALARAIHDPDPKVRKAAVAGLYGARPHSDGAPPVPLEVERALAEALADPELRESAASTLESIHPRDRAVLRAAVAALGRSDGEGALAFSLESLLRYHQVTDPAVLRDVAALLASDHAKVREHAVEILAQKDLNDPAIQAALVRAVADGREPSSAAERAVRALSWRGPPPAAAREALARIVAEAPGSPAAERARRVLAVERTP
jgi:hypothetical protein